MVRMRELIPEKLPHGLAHGSMPGVGGHFVADLFWSGFSHGSQAHSQALPMTLHSLWSAC